MKPDVATERLCTCKFSGSVHGFSVVVRSPRARVDGHVVGVEAQGPGFHGVTHCREDDFIKIFVKKLHFSKTLLRFLFFFSIKNLQKNIEADINSLNNYFCHKNGKFFLLDN